MREIDINVFYMREIDINEFYMGININCRIKYYYAFKIKKNEKDEPQSQFSQLNQLLFTLVLFNFHANYCQYQIK